MTLVETALGAKLHPLLVDRPVWAVKLDSKRNGVRFLSEIDWVGSRPFDWTLDLIDTGDILDVTELWLICPPNPHSSAGNTARLPITEPGTAFQFKNKTLQPGMESISLVIGRVDNKETGECTCFIYDGFRQGLLTPDTLFVDEATGITCHPCRTSIYRFGTWHEAVAPIGALSHAVIGLRLS